MSGDDMKNLLTGIGTAVGLSTLLFAAYQYYVKVGIDARDLRWRRSEAASKLIDTLFADPDALRALTLIAFVVKNYPAGEDGAMVEIGRMKIVQALNAAVDVDAADVYITEGFSRLFFLISRIDDAAAIQYVERADIEPILVARLGRLLGDDTFYAAAHAFAEREVPFAGSALERLKDAARGTRPVSWGEGGLDWVAPK